MKTHIASLGLLSLIALGPVASAADRVLVFVLAGQSNMEGKGFPDPVAWQISQPKYRDRYKHFIKDGDFESFTKKHQASIEADPKKPFYDWSEREDVWINYLGRHGNLTVGYAAPSRCFGPEYNFGHVVGDHFDEQVLLIKCAWGGKSLGRDFRSPSAGLPTQEEFEQMVEKFLDRPSVSRTHIVNSSGHTLLHQCIVGPNGHRTTVTTGGPVVTVVGGRPLPIAGRFIFMSILFLSHLCHFTFIDILCY